MPWTTPVTHLVGDFIDAPDWNLEVTGNMNALRINYATTLPVSPSDGDQAVLVDSTTAPTYQWHFRYNAGSVSSFKWEYIGGAPKISYTQAAVSSAAASNVWSAGLGTSFTLPRQGDYDLRWSGRDDGNGAGSLSDYGIGYGTSPASADQYYNGTNTSQGFHRTLRATGLAASTVLDFYIRDSDSTRRNPWSWRTLEVTPTRVI